MHINNRKFMRLYQRKNGNCADCKQPFAVENLTLHHVPALEDGGNDSSPDNVLLCFACHARRHLDEPQPPRTPEQEAEYQNKLREFPFQSHQPMRLP
jgi:5-methylcytosine-specific restriction endonuclease McrA